MQKSGQNFRYGIQARMTKAINAHVKENLKPTGQKQRKTILQKKFLRDYQLELSLFELQVGLADEFVVCKYDFIVFSYAVFQDSQLWTCFAFKEILTQEFALKVTQQRSLHDCLIDCKCLRIFSPRKQLEITLLVSRQFVANLFLVIFYEIIVYILSKQNYYS